MAGKRSDAGGPAGDGASAIHVHMTNTLNTPVEALELAFPFRLRRYALRPDSGGRGRNRGGDGIVRELEFTAPVTLSVLAEHRLSPPKGAAGGGDAMPGNQSVIRADGTEEAIPGTARLELEAGDRFRIETPGGGGWGAGA